MTRVIMHGCNGRMGQFISKIAENDAEVEIVAGVDKFGQNPFSYPVFDSIDACDVEADVVIDFSNVSAVDHLLEVCAQKQLPCVLCTTGLSSEQLAKVEETAKKTAVLKAANMSIGVNLLQKVLKEVSQTLADAGFDIEIVEKHHNQKLDAPSGTAIALADSVNEGLNEPYEYVFDRSARREKRPQKEIGFSAVRGGTIVGDHDVIFAGTEEVITFSHRAYSREIFAKGAIQAAKFLNGKKSGRYDMSDVIG